MVSIATPYNSLKAKGVEPTPELVTTQMIDRTRAKLSEKGVPSDPDTVTALFARAEEDHHHRILPPSRAKKANYYLCDIWEKFIGIEDE